MQTSTETPNQKSELLNIAKIQLSYKGRNRHLPKIVNASDAAGIFRATWNPDTIELREEFKVILMNHAHRILGLYEMSAGGVTGTVADMKLIFAVALKANASKMIFAHNHPSGNLTASEADKRLTEQAKQAAKFFDMALLDHLILSADGFLSLADEGLM